MKRLRQINTEPLFAEAKANHGLLKFMTRGIDKAKKNSIMIATVQNLKRAMKITQRRIPNEMAKRVTQNTDKLEKTIGGFLDYLVNFGLLQHTLPAGRCEKSFVN